MLYISAHSVRPSSDSFVGVEHDSDCGAHGSGWQVLSESNSDAALVSVGVDDLAPVDSESGVVYCVLSLEDVGHSLSEVEFGSGEVHAVLDLDKGLSLSLGGLTSSESSEASLLVEPDWLSFMIDRLLLGGLDFLCHCFSFCNNDYSIYVSALNHLKY